MEEVLKLNCLIEDDEDEPRYSLNKIKQTGYKIIELSGGYLVIDIQDVTIKFALLSILSSGIVGGGYDPNEEILDLIFHGSGTGSSLRECRHTYWGEDGYLFYMPMELIKEAMAELSKYFD